MVAYTMPEQRKKEESEWLRGERDQIKFIDIEFERWHIVGFRKARGRLGGQHLSIICRQRAKRSLGGDLNPGHLAFYISHSVLASRYLFEIQSNKYAHWPFSRPSGVNEEHFDWRLLSRGR